MWIVFSGRMRSVLRERGKGLNLIVLNGLSLFIVIILYRHRGAHSPPSLFRNENARFLTRFNFPRPTGATKNRPLEPPNLRITHHKPPRTLSLMGTNAQIDIVSLIE